MIGDLEFDISKLEMCEGFERLCSADSFIFDSQPNDNAIVSAIFRFK